MTRLIAQHWPWIARKQTSEPYETALYQILHRTTANEPLKMIQQVEGQRGFEAWHLIVRRYDQRNTSDRSSAYAALISNITERDRAKDVEQFDEDVHE